MGSLDLNRLRVFVKIVQCGSLTRAALLLKMPKSRVSRVLAALERDMRQQLLYRTTRELQLTAAGRELFETAKDAIEQLENAGEKILRGSEALEGLLRITAPEDYGVKILPPLIAEFRRRHPLVRFDLLLSQEVIDVVRESVDIAIRFGRLSDSTLRSQRVGVISLILVASPRFLELNPLPADPRELGEYPCLGFQGSSRKPWRLQDGKRRIEARISPIIEANDPAALYEMALRDQGLALLPEDLCRDALRTGKLMHVFREWRSEPTPLHLVHAYKKEVPTRVKAFLAYLSQELPKQL